MPIEWHHAVALVQQLIDQLAPDRFHPPAGSVPPIETIRLDASGRLGVQLVPADEPFARGVARVLARLLESNPAPANLRLLALQAASATGATMAFDDLAEQIARWERPGRAAALTALYAQASAVADGLVVDVPAPSVEAPSTHPVRDAASPSPFIQALRNPAVLYVATAACVAISLAAFGIYSMFHPASPPVIAAAPPAEEPTPPPTSSPASEDPPAKSLGSRRTAAPATAEAARVASAPSVPSAVADLEPIADEVVAIPVESKPVVIPSVPVEAVPANANAPAPVVPTTREPAVFSSNDAGVSEPILVRPRLPPSPRVGTPSDALGVLEILVDARGAVETVHLRSPGNRYREKWWLFAAKQWEFQPALKDGRPVRFLKRIPLTDLNMLEPQ